MAEPDHERKIDDPTCRNRCVGQEDLAVSDHFERNTRLAATGRSDELEARLRRKIGRHGDRDCSRRPTALEAHGTGWSGHTFGECECQGARDWRRRDAHQDGNRVRPDLRFARAEVKVASAAVGPALPGVSEGLASPFITTTPKGIAELIADEEPTPAMPLSATPETI